VGCLCPKNDLFSPFWDPLDEKTGHFTGVSAHDLKRTLLPGCEIFISLS
jgi:hypothetical protein